MNVIIPYFHFRLKSASLHFKLYIRKVFNFSFEIPDGNDTTLLCTYNYLCDMLSFEG